MIISLLPLSIIDNQTHRRHTMKKLISLILLLVMLTACAMSAFAEEATYGPFTLNLSSDWSLSKEDGMLMLTHDDYPLFMGILMYMSIPTVEGGEQDAVNTFVADTGAAPIECTVNDRVAAYGLAEMQADGMSANVLSYCISFDSQLLVFMGMDILKTMNEQELFALADDLLPNITFSSPESNTMVSTADDGSYHLDSFILRFPEDMEISQESDGIYAMNMDVYTVLAAGSLSYPFTIDINDYSTINLIVNSFFEGLGNTSYKSYEKTTIHDCPAIQLTAVYKQDGVTMQLYGYLIFNGNEVLSLTGTSIPTYIENMRAAVDYTIENMEIAK